MKLLMRSYQNENDYWRIRNFLREVFILNDRRMLSWPVTPLDYWRWHGIMNLDQGQLEKDVYLWETEEGQIVAVLNPESVGQAFLQIHPAYKTTDLEEQNCSPDVGHPGGHFIRMSQMRTATVTRPGTLISNQLRFTGATLIWWRLHPRGRSPLLRRSGTMM
jgi:hypothetical protein